MRNKEKKMDRADKLLFMMTGVSLGIIALSMYSVGIRRPAAVNKAYFMGDLNIDGKDDLIVESKTGYKTPLYAVVKDDGSIYYVSADEYKKMHPNIIIYERIEDKLNSK